MLHRQTICGNIAASFLGRWEQSQKNLDLICLELFLSVDICLSLPQEKYG